MPRRQLVPGDGPLARVSPVVAFLAVAALFAAGVLIGGLVGGLLLGLLVALLAGLLAVSWSQLSPGARALRLLVIAVLAVITVSVAG